MSLTAEEFEVYQFAEQDCSCGFTTLSVYKPCPKCLQVADGFLSKRADTVVALHDAGFIRFTLKDGLIITPAGAERYNPTKAAIDRIRNAT